MATKQKTGGLLTTIIAKLLDDSSQASPDTKQAGTGMRFEDVEKQRAQQRQEFDRQIASEQGDIRRYSKFGIQGLIGPAPTGQKMQLSSKLSLPRIPRVLAAVAQASGPAPVQWKEGNNFRNEPARFVANPEQLIPDPNLRWIIQHESNFQPDLMNNRTAHEGGNKNFGLGQMSIGNRKMYGEKFGVDPDTVDPEEQIQMVSAYVEDRYGTPALAKKFWQITENKDRRAVKELPKGLQNSAMTFIKNGWIGY